MAFNLNNFKSQIKKPICYKNQENPTCIDLVLTNRPSVFQHCNIFQTGIANVHLRIAEQFKMDFQKKLPKVKAFCNYKKNDNIKFRDSVSNLAVDQFNVNNFKEAIFIIIS